MSTVQAQEGPAAPLPQQGPASTREHVLALLRERAWTARELGEAIGIDRKTADYHLHALWRRGLVAQRVVHGERRFAMAHGAPQAFAEAAPGRTRYQVALVVERLGMVGLPELAAEAGVSRGLAAYHARRLAEEGIVRVRRVQGRVVVQAQGLAVQALGKERAG